MMGSDWHAEQRNEAQREIDRTLMQQAGFNLARTGTFSWSYEKVSYTLGLDRTCHRAFGKHGSAAIIGIQTNTLLV